MSSKTMKMLVVGVAILVGIFLLGLVNLGIGLAVGVMTAFVAPKIFGMKGRIFGALGISGVAIVFFMSSQDLSAGLAGGYLAYSVYDIMNN